MELITGAPLAEFGDKTSLVDQVTTRSGLGANKQFGSVEAYYGNFGSTGGHVSYGFGSEHVGNFIALDGTRSGRFFDSPELQPFHDIGNNQTIFDRLDYQPNGVDVFHLNIFLAATGAKSRTATTNSVRTNGSASSRGISPRVPAHV
jgi:hypothetical protein